MYSSNLSNPLTELFNTWLSRKTLPRLWKEAIIVTIYKKGVKSRPKNYRPISLTPAVCRVMETILQRKIVHHLLSNNTLNKSQYGFLPGKNTLSLHLNLLDELTKLHDKKVNTKMLYLDFSKAFDRVSHQKLQFKSSHLSHLILKSFQSTNPNLYILLFKIYIRPILEYNVSIWSPFLIKDLILAENTQKSFTRKLCKKLNLKYENYEDRLKILNLESLELRRVKFDLILVYKLLNNLLDVNSSNFFVLNNIQSKYILRRNLYI